jgi:type I restriction enzyme S subunit
MLNTSVIRFSPIEGQTTFSFLYEYLNFPEFLYKLESMASGSVQKNFGPMHLKQISLIAPTFAVLQAFEIVVRPLFEKVVANRALAASLSESRNALLPRLISGQLSLNDCQATLAT